MSASTATTIENMSLYIPHVFPNFTKEDVTKAFEDNCIGKVKNIDFVAKMTAKDGKVYNAAYIHFEEWYDTIVARNFHSRVRDPTKEARLMYEDPWYWVVLENKARKYIPGERKPCIVIDDKPASTNAPSTPVPADYTQWETVKNRSTWAPVKTSMASTVATPVSPIKLDSEFAAADSSLEEDELEWMDALIEEEEKQMDEIEAAINEDDKYLVSIDIRYIRGLEEENQAYRRHQVHKEEAEYYYNQCKIVSELYKNETIKTQALTEAFQTMIKKA